MTAAVLPVPQFVNTDLATITADLVALYERLAGRTLYPGQYERIFIDLLAYFGKLQREAFQQGCLQQLVAYATGENLDQLCQLVSVTREGAQGATTLLRFIPQPGWSADLVIPAGFPARTRDGKVTFTTSTALVIPQGSTQGEVLATCTTLGQSGNGYQSGDVSVLPRSLNGLASVLNVTATANGTDPESDEHLRARVLQAPSQFSTAGPAGAYRYLAMTAHPDIIDVAVESPVGGVVNVYPLMASGLPNAEILAMVDGILSADTVRPLCDEVHVLAPNQVSWILQARLTLFDWADPTATLAAAAVAAETYRNRIQAGLGRDVIDSQVMAALSVPGVYQVQLEEWGNLVLGPSEWAKCEEISIVQVGVSNG